MVLPGKMTLTAKYGGKTTKRAVTVTVPAKQSDDAWLKLQKTSLLETDTFLGSTIRLGHDIRKIKGIEGDWGFEGTDHGVSGTWNGSYLYALRPDYTETPNYRIETIVTSLQLFKRSITKNEWRRVFGKPVSSQSYEDMWNQMAFYRNDDMIHTYALTHGEAFRVGKLSIWVHYDQKNFVHAFSL